MKSGNLLLGLFTCAALCACTDNDTIDNGVSQTFSGDKAYMIVNICDVGTTGTKADPTFSVGSETEHAVDGSNVHFYFYDKDGKFVQESNAWTDGTANTVGDNNNIEVTGTKIVTLTGLLNKEYPRYVVTVLNAPKASGVYEFSIPNTLNLDQLASLLSNSNGVGIFETEGTPAYFTMSTSSYYDTGNSTYYYATPVTEANFSDEPIDENATTTPVDIYVERLAAKVSLDVDATQLTPTTIASKNYYELSLDNIADNGEKGQTTKTSGNVYIRFDGWALNATAKHSYMLKNIDPSWTETYPGFTWNDATNHRSYWCESYNYGKGSYPSYSNEINDDSDLVSYIDADHITKALGDYDYCAENTNTAGSEYEIIQSKNSSAITSVLLKATVCNSEGTPYECLVRAGDYVFASEDDYLDYALSQLGGVIAIKTSETEYKVVPTTYVELVKNGTGNTDGKVKVKLKDEYLDETFYVLDPQTMDSTGNTYTGTGYQALLDNFNEGYGAEANAYTGGLMYYNIPIEHLREIDEENLAEGMYGVVRNHYYVISITGLSSLGRGIYDTTEKIVPIPESDTYYIGAEVNILSWRLVEQSVTL